MFADFGLDSRLLQALNQMGFAEPTQIQQAAIPLALNDAKDVVSMARTGSGKTVAYLVPILQSILAAQGNAASAPANYGLVLVPSRELADQVMRVMAQLTAFCSKEIKFVNIAQKVPESVRAILLAETPAVVIATPSTALEQLNQGRLSTTSLGYIVFDEADLLASYGYEDELVQLRKALQSCHPQVWLMSATLGDDIDQLKAAWCTKPVTLRLEEDDDSKLQQFYVKTTEFDKFLLMYVIFKLGLIKGKTLVFTNDIDRGYRLKLFFEQFGIRSTVLNSELPLESRVHIVQQFDRNVYNLLIATDESHSHRKDAQEYGVSRGIDFKNVACVINFDLPVSSKAYIHRVGRTARANRSGMALSFVVPKAEFGKHKIASSPTNKNDEKVLARIMRSNQLLPYQFDMSQVDSFRYRMEDGFRAVTRTAVRQARVAEIKAEMLNSEKLRRHFEENPDDLAALRHDAELHPSRVQQELRHVPDYLLPTSARAPKPIFQQTGPFKPKDNNKNNNKNNKNAKGRGKNGRVHKKRRDPLKSFAR